MPNSQYEELARGALLEITTSTSVGALVGEKIESDGVVSVLFASLLPGYPGWNWTVSIAQVDGQAATILEAELMPAEGALLSPDWVPWSERLAEYKAAQAAAEAADVEKAAAEEELSDDDDDDDDDDLGSAVLHGGDLDGVDIDGVELDDEEDDDSDDDEVGDDYDTGAFRGGDHEGVSVDDLDDDSDDDDSDDDDDEADDDE